MYAERKTHSQWLFEVQCVNSPQFVMAQGQFCGGATGLAEFVPGHPGNFPTVSVEAA
ncbi:hypothetical protein UVI_02040210 [Ustilaginoidea virens]|uniref:Uncharacterized protein n=1 Tax=Ustilaginoidea virens TaxID=1159556 RepID=A0A1B5KZN4_USTVR|nr:hypothetical protein UVI_02040210 [Ustilaginoidea virens]